MADLLYKQTATAVLSKAPATPGAAITEKYFDVNDIIDDSTSYNESSTSRFIIAGSVTDQLIGMGTVALGKLLVVKPSADLGVKITNGNGESQLMILKANKLSILHVEFTAIKFTNAGTTEIKGQLLVAGD
jgi:hypothetical protein